MAILADCLLPVTDLRRPGYSVRLWWLMRRNRDEGKEALTVITAISAIGSFPRVWDTFRREWRMSKNEQSLWRATMGAGHTPCGYEPGLLYSWISPSDYVMGQPRLGGASRPNTCLSQVDGEA
ncbi:uncharacterized protein F4822DRAFT_424203 [Hypoxylon trugodes]|uniref:uncharacterized protein n=1 Tax=Hypoxylon trugodes TaxID=326681 RepID=UPI0021A24FC0|nr:uncharacterized protein F4822DRAFT_424203 [Hypoxylon trugodes]KAI1393740.1 hypothetical protein F4822DRAFT_424203 [Hypoxylon trugodes]